MKMKKFLALTATVAMVASMAVGCGNSGNSDKTDGKAETEFDAANDISVVSREDGSGTRGAFIELFGIEEKDASGEKVDNTTEEANITNSTSVMLSTVADNEYAIGYVSLGSLNDTVKALKVDGAEPTEENIKSGEYKVARPFNIATKGEVSEVAQDFIDFILSTEGQAVVSESGYIALDNVQAYAGSKPAGKVSIAGSSSITPVMEKLKEAYLKINPSAEIEIQESDRHHNCNQQIQKALFVFPPGRFGTIIQKTGNHGCACENQIYNHFTADLPEKQCRRNKYQDKQKSGSSRFTGRLFPVYCKFSSLISGQHSHSFPHHKAGCRKGK